jgi:PAS domain S-box-containing protein
MQDRDETESSIIVKSIDELALADAIKQNLFDTDNAPSERRLANILNGHIIERYTDPSRTQRVKRNYHNGRERKIADKKRNHSSGSPLHRHQQPDTPAFDSGVLRQPHNDLTWLDEPQTLYLKRKLHVQDSLTFVDNLARILSSSCVLDAMKKMKLMCDVVASADTVTYPVFAIDCDGKVIAWNNAMEQVTGIPADEMIGKGNHAYSVPFYGTARPMLIDYLILPDPSTDNYVRSHLTVSGEILSSKAETIWLHGKPRVIVGRGTRIHDEKGTIVGAVQSIGIQDPVPVLMQSAREKPESESSPSGSLSGKSPPLSGEVSSSRAPEDLPDCAWNDIGLPTGEIQNQQYQGLYSPDRQEDLRYVLRQLMAKEDDLVRDTDTQTRDPLQPGERGSNTADVLFEHVVMEAREGIIAYDTSLRCILWNTFMEQLTGIPAAGVLGKQAFDMFPALKDAGAYLLLEQALSGKTVESSDISCHIPMSGKQAWLRLIFSSLRDNKGSVIGIIGIVQDTTARKVMEYALQTTIMQLMESEEKYRSVFNAKNDPLLLVDATSRGILDLNTAAADLYGYSREDFFGLSPSDLFTEPEKYNHLLERQSPGTCICRHRKKDGTVFPADISYAYVELKGHLALILSIRDLSTAYQTADALRLANTKLNLLIGITRHDVINNLTVLMGYNDLLKHTVTDPKILAWLEKEDSALKAVHRQIEFTREYYNLGVKSPLWQNICETSTRAYSQFITTIAFTCDTQDLEIYADPLLEKVFYNLFDNAIRHGESITQIRMYCVREGPDLLVIFGDDGEGIVPENKERIFTRGFGKHTGLGLFLTREILAITRIEITETGEFGKGARFELRIPAGSYRFPDSGNPIKMSGTEKMNQHA